MAISCETDIVLANLDWLILHENASMDYSAGLVRAADGSVLCTLADLAVPGATPASVGMVAWQPLDICTQAVISGRD